MPSTEHINDPPPSEFALAVECCRWHFGDGDPSPVEQLGRRVNWERFVQVSRRHRVGGLIWNCLRNLAIGPLEEVKRQLAADAESIAQNNLRAARQSALLLEAFNRAAIPMLFIKGLSLSKLAYGDPLLKMSQDIDVLVPGESIRAAAAELQKLGHNLVLPAVRPDSARFTRWHAKRKESVWRSPDGVALELHGRLADSRDLIPGIGVTSPRQQVEVAPGIVLPTLALDELFAYLCVHGASSAWFRLKWITDLAGLLGDCPPDAIERLYDRSQQLGAGRAAAQALLLAARTYGTASGSALEGRLQREPVNRWLANAAWRQMTRADEPTQGRFGTAMIHFSQLFLVPGVRFKLRESWRQLREAAS